MRASTGKANADMLDLLVHNATLPDGRKGMGLGITAGKIVTVDGGLTPATAPAHETLDAGGLLVSPPFVDAPSMDATLSYGLPRVDLPAAARRHRPVEEN